MPQKSIVLLVLLIFVTASVKVDPETSLFVDQYNRVTVYHGVNAVFKTFPFYPDTQVFSTNYSLTDQDLYNLKHWGMNVIRLHAAWEGIEPEKGVYNYTYVEKVRQIVRKCNKFGIMVLLDAHQDLFVKQFCGEGLPTWVAKRESFPAPLKVKIRWDQDGFPFRQDCLKVAFSEFYMTYDVMKLQKDIFTNQRGLLDHLCKMWQILAAYMSSQPNIIGYEFLNQPIGADIFTNPAQTLLPGDSNNKYLLPAYKRIYQAIRKNDKKNIIFFQPSIIDVFGGSFIQTPGGQNELDKQVFSYHLYCPVVTKLGEPKSTAFCQVFDALTVASKEVNLKKLKIGGFLTEYGALSGTVKSAEQVTTITDLMQQHFRSWTYWQFKYFNDITTMAMPGTTQSFYDQYGNLQENKVKALSRPYAYAICGIALSQKLKKGILQLSWVASDDCYNKKTELFLSQHYYFPKGMSITWSKSCKDCRLDRIKGQQIDFYEINLSPRAVGKKVSIKISPK